MSRRGGWSARVVAPSARRSVAPLRRTPVSKSSLCAYPRVLPRLRRINDGAENTGAESGTLIDASGLNVARGSSSRPNQVPGPEITHNFPLLAQPMPPLPQSNERSHLLHEEGRREPPNQPGAQGHAHRCTQLPFTRPPPVDVPRHQTRSVSQSLSRSASVTSSVTQSASSSGKASGKPSPGN